MMRRIRSVSDLTIIFPNHRKMGQKPITYPAPFDSDLDPLLKKVKQDLRTFGPLVNDLSYSNSPKHYEQPLTQK